MRPYVGASRSDREQFAEWWPRVRHRITNVPENVAEHWVHRHYGGSPYAFLPLDRLRFERQSWSLAQLDAVTFGSCWSWNPRDLARLDREQGTPLAAMMIEAGTWPEPIVILDNPGGLAEPGGPRMGRWHLIEGHKRLTYLRCLAAKGSAHPQHDVWLASIVPGTSTTTAPSDVAGTASPARILEKLGPAVELLASEDGTIQQRLLRACRRSLLQLSRDAFPAEQRELWSELTDALGRVDDPRGSLVASIEAMGTREAIHHVRTILQLFQWACRADARSRG